MPSPFIRHSCTTNFYSQKISHKALERWAYGEVDDSRSAALLNASLSKWARLNVTLKKTVLSRLFKHRRGLWVRPPPLKHRLPYFIGNYLFFSDSLKIKNVLRDGQCQKCWHENKNRFSRIKAGYERCASLMCNGARCKLGSAEAVWRLHCFWYTYSQSTGRSIIYNCNWQWIVSAGHAGKKKDRRHHSAVVVVIKQSSRTVYYWHALVSSGGGGVLRDSNQSGPCAIFSFNVYWP